VVLVAVGAGEEVDGAGAGAVVGGASVGVALAVVGATEGCALGCADGWADGCPDAVAAGALRTVADPVATGDLVVLAAFLLCFDALRAGVCAAVLGGAVVLLTVCAGTARANTIAKPTVASAPSWVVRQVSRPSRRRPSSRDRCGESS
jgi:hypothetical protein